MRPAHTLLSSLPSSTRYTVAENTLHPRYTICPRIPFRGYTNGHDCVA